MTGALHHENIKILLIEDNPADIRLTQEVFREGKIRVDLYIVHNGIEAFDFLEKKGAYQNMPRPDLILLDLNLPKKNGYQVLQGIKTHDAFSNIPVVILTTSKDKGDIRKTYDMRANCFITKPFDLDQFIDVAKSIESFWLTLVQLPGNKKETEKNPSFI